MSLRRYGFFGQLFDANKMGCAGSAPGDSLARLTHCPGTAWHAASACTGSLSAIRVAHAVTASGPVAMAAVTVCAEISTSVGRQRS